MKRSLFARSLGFCAAVSMFFSFGAARAQEKANPSPVTGPTPAPAPNAPTAPNAAPVDTGKLSTSPATTTTELPAAGPVLPLAQALRNGLERHPTLRQAEANSRAADARVDQAFAPLLPQVTATATYSRSTANPVPRAGQVNLPPRDPSFDTYGFWNFGINASYVVYDFGQTRGRLRSAEANAEVTKLSERAQRLNIALNVRNAYFQARQQKALLLVATETLTNQERHLGQIRGFVEIGTRPRIDVVQAQADRESAELQRVNAENNYAIAKAQLVQAMGLDNAPPFEVSDETLAPLDLEEAEPNRLYSRALATRPDVLAAVGSVRAQELSESALKGGYGPSLSVSTGVTEAGAALDTLRWNWNAQAALSWPIFQGGITKAQVREARANVDAATAQVNLVKQQVLLAVEQARIAVVGAKRALATADVLVQNARERLNLAEGRYQTGVGSIIELGDAQLALTNAQQQRVQAEFTLATARAALLNAIGSQ
ncbi:MAG TPA: TolC family protein [Polyangiaceae bacterium]|nr:TolC family protein [Polyangiaceae bacterium]